MQIHSTAKFEKKELSYHNAFDVNVLDAFLKNDKFKEHITILAVKKFKEKCENYFKVDFNKMISFEVYYYEVGNENETQIFKKEKI